jgi:hypothetical protein
MATQITISLASICSGQNHVNVTAAVQGGGSQTFQYLASDLNGVAVSDHDAIGKIIQYHCRGMTPAQALSALTAGFVVNV